MPPDINNWVAASSAHGSPHASDSEDVDDSNGSPELSWDAAMPPAKQNITTGKTGIRIPYLQNVLLPLARRGEPPGPQSAELFRLLMLTIPRYSDAASRKAVLEVIGAMVDGKSKTGDGKDKDEDGNVKAEESKSNGAGVGRSKARQAMLDSLVKWVAGEAEKLCSSPHGTATSAPGTRLALLEWACFLFGTLVGSVEAEASSITGGWSMIVGAMAKLLDSLEDPTSTPKDSVRKSALVNVRRIIRKNHEHIPALFASLTQVSSTFTNAAILGTVVDVSLHLRIGKETQKGEEGGVGANYTKNAHAQVLGWWTTVVLSSRTLPPSRATSSLESFFKMFTSPEDLNTTIQPIASKMILRSPEIALPVLSEFMSIWSHPVPTDTLGALLTPTLSAAKSINPATRAGCVQLFRQISGSGDASTVAPMVEEVAAPLKTGKSSSAEHRATLLAMLSTLSALKDISPGLVTICATLLAKETNEAALAALAGALRVHLACLFSEDVPVDKTAAAAILKGMQDSKPTVRRVVAHAVGSALWQSGGKVVSTSSAAEFAVPLGKAFETNLKNATTNPLAAAAGPLEGYIAVALSYASVSSVKEIAALRKANPALSGIAVGPPKPSFLYVERLYRKAAAAAEEDGVWLARALQAVFPTVKTGVKGEEQFRLAYSQTLLYLAVECPFFETRKVALEVLESLNEKEPILLFEMVKAGIINSFVQLAKATEEDLVHSRGGRLRSLLASLFKPKDTADPIVATSLLRSAFVLCHHSLIDESSSFWIGLVQNSSQDPHDLVSKNFGAMLKSIEEDIKSSALKEAAYRAVSTLAFIAPETTVEPLIQDTLKGLDPARLRFIGAEEYGVWMTPEGTPFVDVLAAQKANKSVTKDADQRAMEQWEAELRESIERKKSGGGKTLTKAEKALVDTQVAKETATRAKIDEALSHLRHSLRLLKSLVTARTSEFDTRSAVLVERLLEVLCTEAAALVASEGFEAFVMLGSVCVDRLQELRLPLALMVLRGVEAKVVSSDLSVEPLAELVTRVLYKIRSLAEQSGIDGVSFAYFAPLLSRVIEKRGLGLPASQVEEAMEQLAIVGDIFNFGAAEAIKISSLRPRLIRDCLAIISNYPQLIKPATTALIAVGAAITEDTLSADIDALLVGLLLSEAQARYAALQAIQPLDLTDLNWSVELWVAHFDDDERNASLAVDLWAENGLEVPVTCLPALLELLEHPAAPIRNAASRSLAAAVEEHTSLATPALKAIADRYEILSREIVPEYDQFGMIIQESLNREDPWRARAAQAEALTQLAPLFSDNDILPLFNLLIEKQSLGDRSEEVRSKMLAAGNAVIDLHGSTHLEKLINTFEAVLAQGSTGSDAADYVAEAAVILFGRLARHLTSTDKRLTGVIERLVGALKTPSEVVQSAVSECLPPLVRLRKDEAPALIERLLQDALRGATYAERRGAAYGLAGAIRGRGLTALRSFTIVSRLRDALEEKKDPHARQGAIFCFEILASSLGRLFEPYLVQTTSLLLTAFGDPATEVRQATQDAARVIMSGLSGHAVKLILPTLQGGLDDKQWRAKKGAIELMGAMAYLAPQQLSSALPTIIPRLTDVLTDTHSQVRAAANASLKRFGEVVTNPEISGMQDALLGALVDPARKTHKALDGLLSTSFVHYIDTSSLALIIPIIERGLRERSADTKRKATQIVGNLATLTEAKDLVPYLHQLMPKMRQVLVDPVPEARATAAKALGGLVERLGEDSFPDLVPSLFDTLRADASGVDQQGAAQGLSEIMSGLGTEKLDELLPDIIANTSSPRAYVREGFISLLVFLPATFGDRFAPYLGRIIQPVLSGLADDSDYVRDASMRAGRMIVQNHSTKAIDLLLPELERGLFDESWRIRQSSIQLLGDLLFRVAGITGKAEIEEDDEIEYEAPSLEASRKVLTETLGKERRDRVLAAVYIIRQDSSGIVRSTSVHVWKALVHNTPKTVREIMPTLMQILVRILASKGDEQRETAARTLGELVRKLGENILGSIISILQKAGTSDDVRTREGACLAIIDVLDSSSKAQLEDHEDTLIVIVRTALVDRNPAVRAAAAQAFDSLQQQVGGRAVEQTLPTLLNALRETGDASEAALAALKELMRVRASSILPKLIPVLSKAPIGAFNARALSTLVSVAGPPVNRYLPSIIDALRSSWLAEKDEEVQSGLDSALRVVFASIDDIEGLNSVMMHLLGIANSETPAKRSGGCDTFGIFCSAATVDFSEYYVQWVRQLVSLFDDSVPTVVDSAWGAMDEMVKKIPKDDMEPLVVPLRRTIENTGMAGRDLAGFSRPAGLKPIMSILLQGILAGTAEQREQAALAFGDVVERTSQDHIKPFVTQITGPLIRIIGDRFPAPVKSAILHTLAILLSRIPQFVKPFFPQLQRTFVKSLSDPTSLTVRTRAVTALGILMTQQPRIDPLVTELVTGARGDDADIRESMTLGLAAVAASGGKNIGDAAMENIGEFVGECFEETHRESFTTAVAKLVGGVAKYRAEDVKDLFTSTILVDPQTQLTSLCLRELIDQSPDAIYELGILDQVITRVLANAAGGQPPSIARPAREAKELLKTVELFAYDDAVQARLN